MRLLSPLGWIIMLEQMEMLVMLQSTRLGTRWGTIQNLIGTPSHQGRPTGRTRMQPVRAGTLYAARMVGETGCNEEVSVRNEGWKTEKNSAKMKRCQKG